MHRRLAFSTLAHDTLGIIPLAAGVVTTLRTSAKNSVRELTDYTTYIFVFYMCMCVCVCVCVDNRVISDLYVVAEHTYRP